MPKVILVKKKISLHYGKKKKKERCKGGWSAITVKRSIENHVFHWWKNSIKVEKEIQSPRRREERVCFQQEDAKEKGGLVCPVSRGK